MSRDRIRVGEYEISRRNAGSTEHSRLLDQEGALRLLRHLIGEDPSRWLARLRHESENWWKTSDELLEQVARQIVRGTMVLQRTGPRVEHGSFRTNADAEATAPEVLPVREPAEDQPKDRIRDWKIECMHHAQGTRSYHERCTLIELVPDLDQSTDTLTLHWRDDHRASMPNTLTLEPKGKPPRDFGQDGQDGGYIAYVVAIPPPVKSSLRDVFSLDFWKTINAPNRYAIGGGPQPIAVNVYRPDRWKVELQFPPMKKIEAGYKYSVSRGEKKGKGKSAQVKTHEVDYRSAKWDRKSKHYEMEDSVTAREGREKPENQKGGVAARIGIQSLAVSCNDVEIKADVLECLNGVYEFITALLRIVDTVQDYAPQMGWYVDFDCQLMQGAFTVEWYWKEATDHRAFKYVDVGGSMEWLRLAIEIGVGVSAFSFKLQVFVEFSFSVETSVCATRDRPDAASGILTPAKGTIAGAVGARVEAGHVLEVVAKLEASIEIDLALGINLAERPEQVSVYGGYTFMGVQCTMVGSLGLWGIGGAKTWTGTLMEPQDRVVFDWFKPAKKYQPPFMTRAAIKHVLVEVLERDWDVRVFTLSGHKSVPDLRWSTDKVAEVLAKRIERDTAFHRTPKMVDALANAIRKDLDGLGNVDWARDWVSEKAFLGYVEGPKLAKIIARCSSPFSTIQSAG